MDFEQDKVKNLDACIKCNACTALCPVAAVHPIFPGPKCIGPDAERFRLEGVEMGTTLFNFCSHCKTCEVTCPSDVKITEMILKAQENAIKTGQKKKPKTFRCQIRDFLLGRAEYVGKLGTIWPYLTNMLLGAPLVRGLMERTLGISRQAPLPKYHLKFRGVGKVRKTMPQVVYFPGCFATYNDPLTGQAIVKVLEHNGYEVIISPFHCCGVPLQTNGYFHQAKENVRKNLALMKPYLPAGIPLITGCTSCSLALKEYPTVEKQGSEHMGLQPYDFFDFLWELYERKELMEGFREVQVSLGYHTPCHLKAQGIGTPAVRLLRLAKKICRPSSGSTFLNAA